MQWLYAHSSRYSTRKDDHIVAECPEVGTVSQGDTFEEATANLKEATELYLEGFPLPKALRRC
jgi:predicted RNase H-like HicB family nuclease